MNKPITVEEMKEYVNATWAQCQAEVWGEPVAWMHWLNGPVRLFLNKDEAMLELERLNRDYPVDAEQRKMRPLVFGDTAPREWVGLTDEQIEYYILHRLGGVATKKNLVNLIRLCESKLKEKNQ